MPPRVHGAPPQRPVPSPALPWSTCVNRILAVFDDLVSTKKKHPQNAVSATKFQSLPDSNTTCQNAEKNLESELLALLCRGLTAALSSFKPTNRYKNVVTRYVDYKLQVLGLASQVLLLYGCKTATKRPAALCTERRATVSHVPLRHKRETKLYEPNTRDLCMQRHCGASLRVCIHVHSSGQVHAGVRS